MMNDNFSDAAIPAAANIGKNVGIDCNVGNCYYNKDNSRCTAGNIQVGPTNAVRGDDTVCATFRPKSK